VLTGKAKKELTDVFRRELELVSLRIGGKNMGSSFASCSIMEKTPVVIMIWNAGGKGWETETQSVAAAIQNMLLKAYSLGLGTVWIGDIFYTLDALQNHLGKPWKLKAAVALGWPAQVPEPRSRRTVNEITEFLS
jgi:nitroreductase